MIEMNVSTSVDSNLKIISYKNCQTIVLYRVGINRVMRVNAACILDAGNHFPAPGSSQECPTELYFVD